MPAWQTAQFFNCLLLDDDPIVHDHVEPLARHISALVVDENEAFSSHPVPFARSFRFVPFVKFVSNLVEAARRSSTVRR